MKKLLFGLIATILASSFSFGQSNKVPELSFFSQGVSSKITLPLDNVYSKFNFDKTTILSSQQKMLMEYFSNFDNGITTQIKLSDTDIKTLKTLLISAQKNENYNWILNNSNTSSFIDFHNLIVEKIKTSNDLESINQLVIFDYSLQIMNNSNLKLSAGCKGWWSCWGKCASSILGGALTGAGTLGLGAAAVGTVTLPVVGTVAGGTVGAVVGGVGGALTGAAAGC